MIDSVINREVSKNTSDHWLDVLRAARIPCGPVNDFGQALSDPQVLARNMVVDVPLHTGEVVRMPGNPVKLSDRGPEHFGSPPRLGQHTTDVLATLLGYGADKVSALQQAGAVN